MIGTAAGATAMYNAMAQLGYAAESSFSGPPKLGPAKQGSSVLVLGAGIAGMVAALELRNAGYQVQVLEYNNRPGGRNWTLYGGDIYTELGGATQHVSFDPGLYFNPGPWRIPYHHQGILYYCDKLNVQLEPFTLLNSNAYVHHTNAFGGKPRRYREVQADFHGHVSELLAKSANKNALDQAITKEEQEKLLDALKVWGALDSDYRYVKGDLSSNRRGPTVDYGGGLNSLPVYSDPDPLASILDARLWQTLSWGQDYDYQTPLFQPKGGMGQIGKAFGRELGNIIKYNCKVVEIHQNAGSVTATYVDTISGGTPRSATADWCVCTIPTPVLSQIPMNVGGPMKAAIDSLPYDPGYKVGLQFKRRFWEQDDQIYGGVSYTNQPNAMIGYPSMDYFGKGKAVLLGAYAFGPAAFVAASKTPEDRIKDALAYGAKVHPQYMAEFENGVSVAWHRVPFTLGCSGDWTEELRAAHYNNLCAFDGRIVLAGEHASRLATWQEGSVTSAIDAITRLHQRASM